MIVYYASHDFSELHYAGRPTMVVLTAPSSPTISSLTRSGPYSKSLSISDCKFQKEDYTWGAQTVCNTSPRSKDRCRAGSGELIGTRYMQVLLM